MKIFMACDINSLKTARHFVIDELIISYDGGKVGKVPM